MSFKQQLFNVRVNEINRLIDNHDAELRSLLSLINTDAFRSELFDQARKLQSHACVAHRIALHDFLNRHRTVLTIKKAFEHLEDFYQSYPDITMMLDRLRAEFTGMVVEFNVVDGHFVISIKADVAPRLD